MTSEYHSGYIFALDRSATRTTHNSSSRKCDVLNQEERCSAHLMFRRAEIVLFHNARSGIYTDRSVQRIQLDDAEMQQVLGAAVVDAPKSRTLYMDALVWSKRIRRLTNRFKSAKITWTFSASMYDSKKLRIKNISTPQP
jgi:hypothetical protein